MGFYLSYLYAHVCRKPEQSSELFSSVLMLLRDLIYFGFYNYKEIDRMNLNLIRALDSRFSSKSEAQSAIRFEVTEENTSTLVQIEWMMLFTYYLEREDHDM